MDPVGRYHITVSLIFIQECHLGKSTLANILLRIFDFEQGQLLVNNIDVRRYNPADYHKHVSAVFQGFSKFNSTVRENVGIGRIENLPHRSSIETALELASADAVVNSLPQGVQTILECPGYETLSYPGSKNMTNQVHGLSGGEVRERYTNFIILNSHTK